MAVQERRLLRAARLSPCLLHVPVSGFEPLILMNQLSKVNGYIYKHQGKGGQGDNLWPKTLARPRQYGRENAARAKFSRLYLGGAHSAA